jgi:chloride channel 3/4/5
MAGRRHGPRLAEPRDDNDGSGTDPQGQYLSLPSSPTSYRRQRPTVSRQQSSGEPPDERSPLLTASRTSRIRIHSAHGSPRVPQMSRNQSYAGTCHIGMFTVVH